MTRRRWSARPRWPARQHRIPNDPDGKLYVVELACDAPLPAPVTLKAVKADARFADFALVRIPRLSVMPVTDQQWSWIEKMAKG